MHQPNVTFRVAEQNDLAQIVALLLDDALGATREFASDPVQPEYMSKLAHGWGPMPLANYVRPVMYSKGDCDSFLRGGREEGEKAWPTQKTKATGSTNNARLQSGGAASGRMGRRSVNLQERQIAARLRSRLAASASNTNNNNPNASEVT